MVQYVHTPWKDHSQLLGVRRDFYPQHFDASNAAEQLASTSSRNAKRDRKDRQCAAASLVSVWVHRGGCPHMVESTALLVAAILSDEDTAEAAAASQPATGRAPSPYVIRAAYSTAFSRFVTGLMDSHQDKHHKMSMFSVAKSVGLPSTFVELRHQATHESLPSMYRLRDGARKALDWVWDYYWKNLPDDPSAQGSAASSKPSEDIEESISRGLRWLLLKFLAQDDAGVKQSMRLELVRHNDTDVLLVLEEISESTTDARTLRRALALSNEILGGASSARAKQASEKPVVAKDFDAVRLNLEHAKDELQRMQDAEPQQSRAVAGLDMPETPGWASYASFGTWAPRPIGL